MHDAINPRPHSRLTPRVRRDVLVDAAAYRFVTSRTGRPDATILQRIGEEVDEALALFDKCGWLDDPHSYHQDPPAPVDVRIGRKRSGNLRYTTMSWLDNYEPRADEPGAARFLEHRVNRVARASL